MTIFDWPSNLFPKHVVGPELRNASTSGGESVNGTTQWAMSDAGYWELEYSEFPVNTRDTTLAWRTLSARLRAGDFVRANVYDKYPALTSPGYSMLLASNAASRATQILVNATLVTMETGLHFNAGDDFYRIVSIDSMTFDSIWERIQNNLAWSNSARWWNDPSDGTALYTISILPPLRAALSSGFALKLKDLTMVCTLTDMKSGDLELEYGQFGSPGLTLREAV